MFYTTVIEYSLVERQERETQNEWNVKYLFSLIVDADGDYQITTRSKAQIRYDGVVKWVCFFFFDNYKI